jgi:hypothetical protein
MRLVSKRLALLSQIRLERVAIAIWWYVILINTNYTYLVGNANVPTPARPTRQVLPTPGRLKGLPPQCDATQSDGKIIL